MKCPTQSDVGCIKSIGVIFRGHLESVSCPLTLLVCFRSRGIPLFFTLASAPFYPVLPWCPILQTPFGCICALVWLGVQGMLPKLLSSSSIWADHSFGLQPSLMPCHWVHFTVVQFVCMCYIYLLIGVRTWMFYHC